MALNRLLMCSLFTFCLSTICVVGNAQETEEATEKKKSEDQTFSVAEGKYKFTAPGSWKKVKPKFDFYQAEFTIPKAEGDEQGGRITFSVVGGTIQQNFDRWVGQFKGLDEGNDDSLKKMSKEINSADVQVLHLQGTFMDSGTGGPFGPKTEREDYVLMGAAIKTGGNSNVYIKAYGPKKTMEANQKQLKAMLEGMQVKASDAG